MAKTIVEKLNLQKYEKAAILDMPEEMDYFPELLQFDTELSEAAYDLVFAFVTDMDGLQKTVGRVVGDGRLALGGYLYIAYPKKGNKVYPGFIHRDELFAGLRADADGYIGNSDVKFARMVGLDDIFTVVGLKHEPRKAKKAAKASQRVGDYETKIADIEKDLEDEPELLSFYRSLTPGYQKDWARHVYSAKQEATREKRRSEMKDILRAGYKSRELYRKDGN